MSEWVVRLGSRSDVGSLAAVERAADSLFPPGRLPAGDDTYPEAALRAAADDGLLFVAALGDRVVGFAFCEVIESYLHLAGLAVHPDFGRRGAGSALVRQVIAALRTRALAGATLTTFADLSWNAPFYARLGFRVLAEDELPTFLAAILQRERAAGMRSRVGMLLD
jgi:predicted N-acetyltransferase YhbS